MCLIKKDICDETAITCRICQRWFEKFRKGDFSLKDAPRGRIGGGPNGQFDEFFATKDEIFFTRGTNKLPERWQRV